MVLEVQVAGFWWPCCCIPQVLVHDPLPTYLLRRCRMILLKVLTWELSLLGTVLYFALGALCDFKYIICRSGTSVLQIHHMNSAYSLLESNAVERSAQSR